MGIVNEQVWTPEQLRTLFDLEERIRRAVDRIQVWQEGGGFPGLVPIEGLSGETIKVSVSEDDETTEDTETNVENIYQSVVDLQRRDFGGYVSADASFSILPEGWSIETIGMGTRRIIHNLNLESEFHLSIGIIPVNDGADSSLKPSIHNPTVDSFEVLIDDDAGDYDVAFFLLAKRLDI